MNRLDNDKDLTKEILTKEIQEMEDQAKLEAIPMVTRPPESEVLELDGDSKAVKREGIIFLYAANGNQLFSVDANTMPWDKKILGAAIQIYILGHTNGRSFEKAKIGEKFELLTKVIFDR